jgi:hypothetical protein
MKTLKQFLVALAVLAAATPAMAGTKFATNLVTSDAATPETNPTLSPKSQIKLSDKGTVQVSLAGVLDGAGVPVNSSTSFADTGTLDGSEYVVIVKLHLPAIEGLFPVVELPVVVSMKAGKGKRKMSASAFFAFIPPGAGRSVEIVGAEVWGPLGGAPEAAACQAVIDGPIPVLFPPDPSCRGGDKIGISGMYIPEP